jgi:hypothetical protein
VLPDTKPLEHEQKPLRHVLDPDGSDAWLVCGDDRRAASAVGFCA